MKASLMLRATTRRSSSSMRAAPGTAATSRPSRSGATVPWSSSTTGDRRACCRRRSPRTQAARVAARVAAQTRDVPVYPNPGITDLPTVGILVRDGPAWRFTRVYGVTREWSPPQRDSFVATYKELLALRPDAGLPFQPTDVAVLFWAADKASGESVPWPSDVPAPPAEAVPGSIPVVPQWRVVPVEYLPALRDLMARVSAAPSQTVTLDGHKWSVQLKSLYRGQRTAECARACARHDPRIWGQRLTPGDGPPG